MQYANDEVDTVAGRYGGCALHQWMVTSVLLKCVNLMRHIRLVKSLDLLGYYQSNDFMVGWGAVWGCTRRICLIQCLADECMHLIKRLMSLNLK